MLSLFMIIMGLKINFWAHFCTTDAWLYQNCNHDDANSIQDKYFLPIKVLNRNNNLKTNLRIFRGHKKTSKTKLL